MLAGTFRGRLYYILRSNFLLPGSEFNLLNRNDKKNRQYRVAYYPGLIIFPVPYRRHLLANQREIGRRIQKQESFIGVSVHFRQFCSQRRKSSSRYVILYTLFTYVDIYILNIQMDLNWKSLIVIIWTYLWESSWFSLLLKTFNEKCNYSHPLANIIGIFFGMSFYASY